MTDAPLQQLTDALRQSALVRLVEHHEKLTPDAHRNDLVVDALGPRREMTVGAVQAINFGSDSFLGLDQDPRVQEAICQGVRRWGAHNGASRAFASVRANQVAEDKLAGWLGTEETLIYPSVTLANMGALPALVGKGDILVLDEHAHNSMHEGAKIAQANGTRLFTFRHSDPGQLADVLHQAQPYRLAVVAVDGMDSMTGDLPPLPALNEICRQNQAVLYVDDAHGAGVLGQHGRGTVLDALGSYDNVLVVGSLSKAFSCCGGFLGCPRELKKLLKIRFSTFTLSEPVPPPYLEAVCVVCDILMSGECKLIQARLRRNVEQLTQGAQRLGLVVLGKNAPIISILVGAEEMTFAAGHFLFQQGYYVQSVTFPAAPYHAGVLRIQINANHRTEDIDGLIRALAQLQSRFALPQTDQSRPAA